MTLALVDTARPTVEPFSKDDIKALRSPHADGVAFHHDPDHEWIGAIVVNIRSTLYGQEVEARVEIPVNSAIVNYEEGRASDHPASDEELATLRLRASHLLHFPSEKGGIWQTIAASLRPGDQVQLMWLRGNYNLITRQSGLAVDQLELRHLRNHRTVGTYHVGYSVGKKNCARMIRSERESYTYG